MKGSYYWIHPLIHPFFTGNHGSFGYTICQNSLVGDGCGHGHFYRDMAVVGISKRAKCAKKTEGNHFGVKMKTPGTSPTTTLPEAENQSLEQCEI